MNLIELLAPDQDPLYQRLPLPSVVIGVVTNNQDPDGLARVRVIFPWLGDDHESAWARVATPMAGGDRGLFLLPEVGDEVVVMFLHGDIRCPLVIGALWNGVDTPPSDNGDGDNNVRFLKSRSGHTITLDDTEDAGKIKIVDASGANAIVIDTAENVVTVTADADIVLQAPKGKIALEAQEVEITGSSSVTIGSDGSADLTASSTLTLEGQTVNIN